MTSTLVSSQPFDPGVSGWSALLSDSTGFAPLEQSKTFDFLIIGAGFAGLSAARKLRQQNVGASIAVVEARGIAEGPAGRNSGFMIDLPHNLSSSNYVGSENQDRIQTGMNRRAIAFAKKACEELEMPDGVLDLCGKINAAATAKGTLHNRNYSTHLQAMGEDFQWLDAAAMRDLCGSEYYESGLYTPGTALLQPARYIHLLAQGLSRQGVRVFENSPVLSLQQAGSGWVARTSKGQISAGKVILAVNGHAESFGYYSRRLMHIYLYASMTRVLTKAETAALGGQACWGFTPADPMGTTVRRISGIDGDRILVRNRFTWAPQRTVDESRLKPIAQVHQQSFVSRFPQIAHVDMEYCWGGLLCLSRNNVPAFGELETNLYAACCQNGLGTVQGTLTGMLAAELASGETSDHLESVQAMPNPQKLPAEPFASLGANAYMRWLEFRAGKEM